LSALEEREDTGEFLKFKSSQKVIDSAIDSIKSFSDPL
jgi:hypothetical protein